jgi:glycosyltransferase involved in cell wall biosynthesis
MKIVHIEDFFFPSPGYQINLLTRFQAAEGHSVVIVTSELDKIPNNYTRFFGTDLQKDKKFTALTGVKIVRVPIIAVYSGRSIYYPRIFRIVDSLRPDVLFIHGVDTLISMQYILRYAKLGYPVVLDCHMLEMASLNRFRSLFRAFYKKIIASIITSNSIPVIRVVDVDYVEKCLGIPLENTIHLSLGTDTVLFRPNKETCGSFRAKHQIGENDFVVIYAGKLDRFKNGLFLAEAIKSDLRTATGRKIVFLIIGNTEGYYGNKVEELFSISQNKILREPTQDYFDLAGYYQAADLAVFPTHCSLSFFDLQSCGVPVLFEKNEINEERSRWGNGITFIPGDVNDFRQKIVYFADMKKELWETFSQNSRRYIVDKFDFGPTAKRITGVLEREVRRFGQKRHQNGCVKTNCGSL